MMFARLTGLIWGDKKAAPQAEAPLESDWTELTGSTLSNNPTSLSDTSPTTTRDQDALGQFQSELATKLEQCEAKLQDWLSKKIEIKSPHPDISDIKDIAIKPTSIFARIKESFASLFLTAHQDFENTFSTHTAKHIQALSEHLSELCEAHQRATSEDEKQKLKIQICDYSIAILNELKALMTTFISKINNYLKDEKLGEIAVKKIIAYLFELTVHLPLPEFDFTLQDKYRVNLNNRIADEETKLQVFVASIEGLEKRAMEVLIQPASSAKPVV